MTAQWGRLRAAIDKLSPDWARALRVVCDDLQAGRALTESQHAATEKILARTWGNEVTRPVWDVAYVLYVVGLCGNAAWSRADVLDALACAERAS